MLSLYFRLIGARIRAQMQYKVSFWMDLLGFGLVTGLEFASIAILYGRFQSIGGWSIAEVWESVGTPSSMILTQSVETRRRAHRFRIVIVASALWLFGLVVPTAVFLAAYWGVNRRWIPRHPVVATLGGAAVVGA